jgi:hypothetical protein
MLCSGFALSQDCEYVYQREGINFVQPMRDFLQRDIAAYNWHAKVESIIVPTFDTLSASKKCSIDHLTEGFVMRLQSDFSHTVHTLLRCIDKLTPPRAELACAMCLRPLAAEEAARSDRCSNECGGCGCEVKPALCYTCRITLGECSSNALPAAFTHRAAKARNRAEMRKALEGFILDE